MVNTTTEPTTDDIGLAVERVLESTTLPAGLTATVRRGVVVVSGTVEHGFQKNEIIVKANPSERVVHSNIVAAMHRNADLDAKNIRVLATGHEVWLSGRTRSLSARNQAEAAAWSAPGVETVYNDIVVGD